MLSHFINLLPHLSQTQWLMLCICALCTGLSKTALPGIGIVIVPFMASFFPASASTGLVLVLLAIGDIFAVSFYHRHANWNHILKLLPFALVGMAAGSFVIRRLTDVQLSPVIGVIVLAMLIFNYLLQARQRDDSAVPKHWLFAVVIGFFAGFTTQLANAAGPIMMIYLLAMRLPKYEFIGTGAWYFLILNWIKVPIFISEGRITFSTLAADSCMLPLIIVGAVSGLFILKNVPQKWFNIIIQILAAAGAIKLLF